MRAALLALLAFAPIAGVAAPTLEEASLRSFLEHYFATWSARDFEAYAACFDGAARISFALPNGQIRSEDLPTFLASQRMAHARAPEPMVEVPTKIELLAGPRVTMARVRWRLTRGSSVQTGTDFFTLVRRGDRWRIVSLVFFND